MQNTNNLPTPVTAEEKFAAKAAGMSVETPTPVTNMEKYLDAIAEGGGGGGGGTSNYNQLTNKPSINGVTLTGNKTTSDLGIVENVQADWDEADSTAPSYIQNKPNIPSGVVVDQVYDSTSTNAQSGTAVASAISGKISATDYATQTTGGTIKAWTTTDGSDTILHLATQ